MGTLLTRRSALMAFVALATACTVHQDKTPSLTGPSEFGQSVTITATPDSISQDGASQSAIVVSVRGPNGAAISGVSLRLQTAVGGALQDFGTLSAKNIVTSSDGKAAAVYTAPPAPPPAAGGTGSVVTIVVTPTGSNFQTANSQTADIRLVPTGVILSPRATPTAAFTFTPNPASVNVPTTFDASASCATSDPCTSTAGITSFRWNFGDGTTGTGQTASKTYRTGGTYTVTLTVTNDLGLAASSPQTVDVGTSEAPAPDFVFSPSEPLVGQEVQFNASQSVPAVGRTITRYAWNWGDGETATGRLQDHDYQTAGEFTVTLTVTDDAGQSATAAKTITVADPTIPTPLAPVAIFTSSPPSPTLGLPDLGVVNFDAGTSLTPSGAAIVNYRWNFGDGTAVVNTPLVTFPHTYTSVGAKTVTLIVTDTNGLTASTTGTVTIVP